MKNWLLVSGLALSVASVACVGAEPVEDEASVSESALDNQTTVPSVQNGGGCKITGGSNAGKSGTYDTSTDPGHVWCCTGPNGSGSCTECSGSGGGNCTATSIAPPVKKPPRYYTVGTGAVLSNP